MARVDYQLRPNKHVERKMFVDVLTHLREIGCAISDYHYVGFGSPYYIDFMLFRRQLFIKKMTCYENDSGLIGRVQFNKPYDHVKVLHEDATPSVPTLIHDKEKYFIWLDYEQALDETILETVNVLAGNLPVGSVLAVTVNTQLPNVDRDEEITRYMNFLPNYIAGIVEADIVPAKIKQYVALALKAEMQKGSSVRSPETFAQLFNYSYADNAEMITFGGIIIEDTDERVERIRRIDSVNSDDEPYRISVPTLTHKERIWLDNVGKSSARTAKTGLMKDEIDKYFEFSQHYPTYYEIAV